MLNKSNLSRAIINKAKELGFENCGISKADFLEKDEALLKKWINEGMHGDMYYMENHFDKRVDPRKIHEGAKSVISVLLNYYPEQLIPEEDNYKISKYAYGTDYHYILKNKLKILLKEIKKLSETEINARIFVDSAPVLDQAWASKSGLGWIGKNTCLIVKNKGSFFFIGEIICDLELDYNKEEIPDYCGSCTKCLNACPTNALLSPYKLDARKCISYFTIEYKGKLPEKLKECFGDMIFGCDICQDVCPHNRFAKPTSVEEFTPKAKLMNMKKTDWEKLDKEKFEITFKNTALERTKYEGLKRNINFLKKT
jgi:epoxyqueuosine reductase